MDENILKFRVGIFVVIAMLILGILVFLNSEGWTRQYTVYMKPVTAPGVTVGTPVRKNGILIGRVKSVKTQDDHVLVGLSINEDEFIYANEMCSIGSESFLGDAMVEILPLPKAERGERVSNNFVINRVAVRRNPMEIVDVALNLESDISKTLEAVRTAGESVNDAGTGVRDLTDLVQDAFENDDSDFKRLVVEIREMSERAQVAMDNFDRVFENINDIVGDEVLKGEIKKSIGSLPTIFEEVRVTVGDTRETINSFRSVSGNANDNLDNLKTFTGSLKENGPAILVQTRERLDNVNQLLDGIQGFTETLNKLQNSEGTVGKLLNDTEIYDNVLETVENVREVSVKLEPLVNDLRAFADILARDPGMIGVRGALDRRPGKTGYKGTAGREGGLFK